MKFIFTFLFLVNGCVGVFAQNVPFDTQKSQQPTTKKAENPLERMRQEQQLNLFKQNEQHIQKVTSSPEQQKAKTEYLLAELKADEELEKAHKHDTKGKAIFKKTLASLETILQTKQNVSVKNAVFMVENAFYGNTKSLKDFEQQIKVLVIQCKAFVAANKWKFETQEEKMKGLSSFFETHFHYDFNDFMAINDRQNYLVHKLLKTKTGQCHSMPLLFKILADEIGLQTYISFSPEHSFIKIKDSKGELHNFETTNGSFVSNKFIIASGFINQTALQSKIYNDTLNSYQIIAYCVSDLAWNYKAKYGMTEFSLRCANVIDRYSKNKLHSTMLRSEYYAQQTMKAIKKAGYPPSSKIYEIPTLKPLLLERDSYYKELDALGQVEISIEDYQKWLKTTK